MIVRLLDSSHSLHRWCTAAVIEARISRGLVSLCALRYCPGPGLRSWSLNSLERSLADFLWKGLATARYAGGRFCEL